MVVDPDLPIGEYNPNWKGRRGRDSTLWCGAPFNDCAEWYQDSRRSSIAGARENGWTRHPKKLWLCPDCTARLAGEDEHD